MLGALARQRPDSCWETLAVRTQGLTAAQMEAEARRVIDSADFVWIVVGEAATVRPQLERLGMPVEVRAAQ